MKITDLKCAVIGNHPVIRIVTDEGIDGYGQIESSKPYMKPHVLFYRDRVLGMDPTDVERVMLNIRRLGSFKPWGSAVSAIEMALWDVAGKAAGLPVYKLLGGKIRDRVRVHLTGSPAPLQGRAPDDYADVVRAVQEMPEGYLLLRRPVAAVSAPGARPDDGKGPQARHRLRRGDEGCPG